MISYLAGFSRKKDSVFEATARAAGGGKRLLTIPLSFRGFRETKARVAEAMAVAKRQPRGTGRVLKRWLITLQYNGARRYFQRHPNHLAMCWNGLTGSRRAFMQAATDAGAATLYAELAPFPDRITLDPCGVNARNSLPQDPQFYRSWAAGHPARAGEGWRDMGANLVARASRRSDVGQGGGANLDAVGPYLFVPLQVPNDSQITVFGGWVGSVAGMIAALDRAARHLPEGWHIRVKEHPSAKASLADLLSATGAKIVVDNHSDTFEQVAASRGVITINSSVGLQAFFYEKPVIVLGKAFFALPGLAEIADTEEGLRDALGRAANLQFDATLRASFMNYLDKEYFPSAIPAKNGALSMNPREIEEKIAQAQAQRP